jgi:CRP-like cAMP-binding protein
MSTKQKENFKIFPIFQDCAEEDFKYLQEKRKFCKFRRGEYIFRENTPATGTFCLEKGSAKIVKKTNTGYDQIVSLAKPGDIFGLHCIINETVFNASAISLEDTCGCFISREHLFMIFDKRPTVKFSVMKALCNKMDEIENKIATITQKPVEERVRTLILTLYNNFGLDESQSLNLNITREEFANIAHVRRTSLNRILNQLRREGIIDLKNKMIQILDVDALMAPAI